MRSCRWLEHRQKESTKMAALTSEQIEDFLDRLNDETDFRDRLICDPGSVFTEYGIPYDLNELPNPSETSLPDVGDVNANRQAYRDALFPDDEAMFHGIFLTLPSSSS